MHVEENNNILSNVNGLLRCSSDHGNKSGHLCRTEHQFWLGNSFSPEDFKTGTMNLTLKPLVPG